MTPFLGWTKIIIPLPSFPPSLCSYSIFLQASLQLRCLIVYYKIYTLVLRLSLTRISIDIIMTVAMVTQIGLIMYWEISWKLTCQYPPPGPKNIIMFATKTDSTENKQLLKLNSFLHLYNKIGVKRSVVYQRSV